VSQTTEKGQGALRFLHTMIRVRDIEKSILFYTTHFGMELLRRKDYPEGRFTLAFLGFGPEDTHTVLELTYNWDQETPYEVGTGFGHIAFGVSDIYKVCEELANTGVKITRSPGPMKHGTTVIAFLEDPDGYKIELIER
jgi:lactoylglutathione lyase